MTTPVETSTQTETPPPATPIDSGSIADHEAQFGTTRPPAEAETEPQRRERHRAKSQRAGVEDVGRIGELTKKWRGEEERANKLASELDQLRRAAQAPVTPKVEPSRETPKPAGDKFTFDTIDAFIEKHAGTIDAAEIYEAYQDAKREAYADWRDEQKAVKARSAEDTKARDEAEQKATAAYQTKLAAFVSTKPDFAQKFTAAEKELTDRNIGFPLVLEKAIKEDDNGPELLYHLLSHPADFDEMLLLADGKSVSPTSVALLRRRLSTLVSRSQAVLTGSAVATASPSLAPRPPNPVRTGPMKTGDEPPGEGHSIADHAKHWGERARR